MPHPDPATRLLSMPSGRVLAYVDWGPADGYPVLVVHGAPDSRLGVSHMTRDIVAEVGGRLITYDRPGYGRSDRDPGYRAVDRAADVAHIGEALGLQMFAVTGGSAGSVYTFAAAARLADRVSRILVDGVVAPLEVLGLDEWERLQDPEIRAYFGTARAGIDTLTRYVEQLDAESRATIADDDPTRELLLEPTRQGVGGWVDDMLAIQGAWGFDITEIGVPAAIWSNPRDTVTPPNHARWVADRIPGAVLVSSPNAFGHAPVEDVERARRAMWTYLVEGTVVVP
jgi:pimeloyl-ACP methyl ester carboxylesterase